MLGRVAIGLLSLALVALPGWVLLHRGDLPDPGDSDLDPAHISLAPAADGYVHLLRAATALHWPDGSEARLHALEAGDDGDGAWLHEMLARNAPAFAELELGLSFATLRYPALRVPAGSPDEGMNALLELRKLVRLSGPESRLLLEQGQQGGAFERALLGARLGFWAGSGIGLRLSELMLTTALQSASLDHIEALTRRAILEPGEALALSRRLESLRIPAEWWSQVWVGEYQLMKRGLLAIGVSSSEDALLPDGRIARWLPGSIPSDYLWQPNRTLSHIAGRFRGLRQRAERSCAAPDPDPVVPPAPSRLSLLLLPNPVGRIIEAIGIPNLVKLNQRRCLLDVRVSLAQVGIALSSYWHARGSLPERLEGLIPAYLDVLPRDAFSGEPLRYPRSEGIVYSIGSDRVDRGGSRLPRTREASEPTLRLDFRDS